MAKLAAGYAGTQAEVADTDCIVFKFVGEVVLAFRHGADKDTDALFRVQCLDIVRYSYDRSFET